MTHSKVLTTLSSGGIDRELVKRNKLLPNKGFALVDPVHYSNCALMPFNIRIGKIIWNNAIINKN